jgi:hypothetical protein
MTSAVVGAYRLMLLIWFTVSTSGPHRTELRDPAYARAVLRQTRALSQQQVEWFVGEQRQAATE